MKRYKSYNFWLSVISAVMVLLASLSDKINLPYIDGVLKALLGVMAVSGIVSKPATGDDTQDKSNENEENEQDGEEGR